jgi:hypothetical protein
MGRGGDKDLIGLFKRLNLLEEDFSSLKPVE